MPSRLRAKQQNRVFMRGISSGMLRGSNDSGGPLCPGQVSDKYEFIINMLRSHQASLRSHPQSLGAKPSRQGTAKNEKDVPALPVTRSMEESPKRHRTGRPEKA